MNRNTFKIVLLVIATALVVAILLYSQHLIQRLLDKEHEVVDLYAKSYEYVSSEQSSAGDFTFLFDEVIRAIDFPVILTDPDNNPIYWKNIDTVNMSEEQKAAALKRILTEMDERNKPIRIALNDTVVLNYIHYGESELITQLRWLPYVEISLAAMFILIAYVGFSYIKRSEQSNIWVGMAKETAHQLGTPLSSLMGWMEIVKSESSTSPQLRETLLEMESDIERLNKVTARFSKIGSKPDLKLENIPDIINGVIQYIAKRIPRSGKTVDITIDSDVHVQALINRELFEWVVENLMKNALDAMEESAGRISFAVTRTGHRTTIDVTDTGKGIDPKFHREVFRPGYSTKKRGWGLGLSLSKRIIEDYHKGKLYVKQSIPGQGTTFRIRLVK